jgi:hypothetical protein
LEHHKDDIFPGKDADLLVLVPEYSEKKKIVYNALKQVFLFMI